MNTIVCLEPWLSDCGEGLSKRDTGFGNRVIDWAILYYISTLLEDCELLVQEEYQSLNWNLYHYQKQK